MVWLLYNKFVRRGKRSLRSVVQVISQNQRTAGQVQRRLLLRKGRRASPLIHRHL